MITIDVFDGPEMSGCSGCSGCAAGGIGVKAATEQIETKILNMYADKGIVFNYIDTQEKGLSNYPEVAEVVSRGYSFPVISLNGLPRLAGAINMDDIEQLLKEFIAAQNNNV